MLHGVIKNESLFILPAVVRSRAPCARGFVVKPTRPYRDHSVYASPCVDCQVDVESNDFPIPLRCPSCQMKRDKQLLKDRPDPVRSTTGSGKV